MTCKVLALTTLIAIVHVSVPSWVSAQECRPCSVPMQYELTHRNGKCPWIMDMSLPAIKQVDRGGNRTPWGFAEAWASATPALEAGFEASSNFVAVGHGDSSSGRRQFMFYDTVRDCVCASLTVTVELDWEFYGEINPAPFGGFGQMTVKGKNHWQGMNTPLNLNVDKAESIMTIDRSTPTVTVMVFGSGVGYGGGPSTIPPAPLVQRVSECQSASAGVRTETVRVNGIATIRGTAAGGTTGPIGTTTVSGGIRGYEATIAFVGKCAVCSTEERDSTTIRD